ETALAARLAAVFYLLFPNYKTCPCVVVWDLDSAVDRSPLTVKHSKTKVPSIAMDKTERRASGTKPFTSLRLLHIPCRRRVESRRLRWSSSAGAGASIRCLWWWKQRVFYCR